MVGIVLGGGYSSRAKVNKLLLDINGEPLIFRTIESIRPFVDKVTVVTGFYHNELTNVLFNVDVIYNNSFDKGMFSSVKAGIKNVDDDVIIIPGDIPNVSPETVQKLINGNKDIRIPSFNGVTGHPIILSKKIVTLLKGEPITSRLCDFIDKHSELKEIIEVDDKYINFDIDTIDDYNDLRKEIAL